MLNPYLLLVLLCTLAEAQRSLSKRNNEYGDAPKSQLESTSTVVTKEESKSASAPSQKPQPEGYGLSGYSNAVVASGNSSSSLLSSNETEVRISTSTAKPDNTTAPSSAPPIVAATPASNNQYGDEPVAPSNGPSSTENIMPEQQANAVSQNAPEKAPSHSSGY